MENNLSETDITKKIVQEVLDGVRNGNRQKDIINSVKSILDKEVK